MSCKTRVNFIAPQYTSNACMRPEERLDGCKCQKNHSCRRNNCGRIPVCGTPCNFISPECEEIECEYGEMCPTMQMHIICMSCVKPVEPEMIIENAGDLIQRILAGMAQGNISFKYAGGKILYTGVVSEPVTGTTPQGTRRIFLSVPVIAFANSQATTPGFMYGQFYATYSALLMPCQCNVSPQLPYIDVIALTDSPNALTIDSYEIDAENNRVILNTNEAQSSLKLYFTQYIDNDVYMMPSSVPEFTCPPMNCYSC